MGMFAPRAFLFWGVAIGEEQDLGDEHRRAGRPGPPDEEALKRLKGHEAREREAAIPSIRSDGDRTVSGDRAARRRVCRG